MSVTKDAMNIELLSDAELNQLFQNNADCYADTWRQDELGAPVEGEVIPAMTAQKFIEVVKSVLLQIHAN